MITPKKLLIVNNNADWSSYSSKINFIKSWALNQEGLPEDLHVDLTIDSLRTNFTSLPFELVYTTDPMNAGGMGVSQIWYDTNIAPLAVGYDYILFHYSPSLAPVNVILGLRTRRVNGAIEMHVCADENENLYVYNKETGKDDIFHNKFESVCVHELAHSFALDSGSPDITDQVWAQGDLLVKGIFKVVKFNTPTTADKVSTLKSLLASLQSLVAQLIKKRDDLIKTTLLDKFCLAIQKHEGWMPGSRSYRNNNPGNLKMVGQRLAIGQDKDGFAIFKSGTNDGYQTLKEMVYNAAKGLSKVYRPQMTFLQFFSIFAPPSDNNDSLKYAMDVATDTGLTINSSISSLMI